MTQPDLQNIEAEVEEAYNSGWLDCREGGDHYKADLAKNAKVIQQLCSSRELAGRIDENQRRLDYMNNWKPKPGQLTAASFGSAGAGLTESAFKHSFEDRIAELKALKKKEK